MHLLSPFSLNLPLYEHKKRPSYQQTKLGGKELILSYLISSKQMIGNSVDTEEVIFLQVSLYIYIFMICLFDLILNVPSTIFQLYRDGSSWVEPVLS